MLMKKRCSSFFQWTNLWDSVQNVKYQDYQKRERFSSIFNVFFNIGLRSWVIQYDVICVHHHTTLHHYTVPLAYCSGEEWTRGLRIDPYLMPTNTYSGADVMPWNLTFCQGAIWYFKVAKDFHFKFGPLNLGYSLPMVQLIHRLLW